MSALKYKTGYTFVNNTTSKDQFSAPIRLQMIFDELKARCYKKFKNTPPLKIGGTYCNRTIDNIGGCWPDTLPGQRASIPCPDIPSFNINAHAYRDCTINGTWYVNKTTDKTWANYSECRSGDHTDVEDISDIYVFIGGYALSLVLLVVSLIIFFRFRQLRCDRITIHKNLFLSYVLTGISWILYYTLTALDGRVQMDNPTWCQVLHVICQYFTVCNFLWMFCEGLYLNTIMVYAFSSGKSLIISCYIIGWGIPLLLTALYAGLRSTRNMEKSRIDCWLQESNLVWIMYGPIVISLVVNVLFLANIVRLLVTKLRQMPEADQTKKATRATLILVPLLGIQYLLFPIRPERDSSLYNLYHIVVALFVSLQGAFVSLIYCFFNGEVIALLKRKWKQRRLMRHSSMRTSTAQDRNATTYTTIDHMSQGNAATYYSISDNKMPPMEMSKLMPDENEVNESKTP